jgi:lysophospholipase L1-like esterase
VTVRCRSCLAACLLFVFGGVTSLFAEDASAKLELKDGDRVVLLGGTFIEREGQFGFLETALTTAWPDRRVTFRNLGWSGDTVWAESRGIFDAAQVGYNRMLELVKELKPTLIILAYGQNESFAGDAGLGKFVAQYEKLCDDLTATGARLAFMTPHKFECPKPPLPDASRQNGNLGKYAAAVVEMASRRHAPVINLFQLPASSPNLTENGMHFGDQGYAAIISALGSQEHWKILSKNHGKIAAIRQKVVEKNMQFFHRWRPQNITYLTGFRKHEQGNNAVEIAQFDPLVAQLENEIAEILKK